MENPTYIALSRLVAQQRSLEVIAGNIANASTPGYRAEHLLFSDWLVPTRDSRDRTQLAFTQDRASWRDQTQGSITHTGEPLDVAIGHQGFFSLQTKDGVRLTRAGSFTLDTEGNIVDGDGNRLLDDQGSPLVVERGATQISIAGDGTISSDRGRLGKIGVVVPSDLNRLYAEGSHLFRSESSTSAVAAPALIQGGIESSNVSPMLELTQMTNLGKDFQYVTQFVESESERQQTTIDKLMNFSGS